MAFVTNSMLGFDGILEYMLEDSASTSPASRRPSGSSPSRTSSSSADGPGQNTVLILDEAQNLDPQTLEQIRLLSNFETTEREDPPDRPGRASPSCERKLDLPELRQLKQRIGLRCRIPPLTPEQVRDYIRTRLRIAGARDLGTLHRGRRRPDRRVRGGIPRLVNTVCDHCLLIGYADQIRRIDRDIVEQAIAYLDDGEEPRRSRGGSSARGA